MRKDKLPLLRLGFNTSHVTLYPLAVNRKYHKNKFQYISCYSLSPPSFDTPIASDGFNTSHVTLYQLNVQRIKNEILGFNTSHVTLYRTQKREMVCFYSCFTTSHVTLYLTKSNGGRHTRFVSIHLMLLFIFIFLIKRRWLKGVSIHLMLLFIPLLYSISHT